MGPETLTPFVECSIKYGKGLFILVKTSNPGSGWLQDKKIDEEIISDRIAMLVAELSLKTIENSGLSSIGAVVGATYPEEGKRLRGIMNNSVILAPGIGAQGGNQEDIQALRRQGISGVLVPVSRGITKVDDLTITRDDYAGLIREQICFFKKSLK